MILSSDTINVQKGNANVPTSMSLAARPRLKIFVVVLNLVLEKIEHDSSVNEMEF